MNPTWTTAENTAVADATWLTVHKAMRTHKLNMGDAITHVANNIGVDRDTVAEFTRAGFSTRMANS